MFPGQKPWSCKMLCPHPPTPSFGKQPHCPPPPAPFNHHHSPLGCSQHSVEARLRAGELDGQGHPAALLWVSVSCHHSERTKPGSPLSNRLDLTLSQGLGDFPSERDGVFHSRFFSITADGTEHVLECQMALGSNLNAISYWTSSNLTLGLDFLICKVGRRVLAHRVVRIKSEFNPLAPIR